MLIYIRLHFFFKSSKNIFTFNIAVSSETKKEKLYLHKSIKDKSAEDKILKLSQKFNSESLIAGLKLHKKDNYILSYSDDGYSIGIDLNLNNRSLKDLEIFFPVFNNILFFVKLYSSALSLLNSK